MANNYKLTLEVHVGGIGEGVKKVKGQVGGHHRPPHHCFLAASLSLHLQ